MGFFKEFKEFANRGNVMDMAIGIILGGAFGKIVTSFVDDIIMPPIGMLLNGVDFKDLKVVLQPETINDLGVVTIPAITINYGMFVQTIIDFLIIALAIFLVVRSMNKLKRQKETDPEPPASKSDDILLLEEIRDILKNK